MIDANELRRNAQPGPWSVECDTGIVTTAGGEQVAAIAPGGCRAGNAALVASAPALAAEVVALRAVVDDVRERAEGAEAIYAGIKRRLGQSAGDGQWPHDAIDAIERALSEIEDAAGGADDYEDVDEILGALRRVGEFAKAIRAIVGKRGRRD